MLVAGRLLLVGSCLLDWKQPEEENITKKFGRCIIARKKPQSYRDLEIWQMAHELAVMVHKMTLEKLPKFELYEEGSQLRRSSKSISNNIVEGYGRRRYKNEYIKFLTYALASCDETRDHIEFIFETGFLTGKAIFDDLCKRYDILGRKINNFLQGVINKHLAPKDQIGEQIDNDSDNDECE